MGFRGDAAPAMAAKVPSVAAAATHTHNNGTPADRVEDTAAERRKPSAYTVRVRNARKARTSKPATAHPHATQRNAAE